MPTVEQILEGLHAIANQWRTLAILWHLYFAALALALVAGRLPSRGVTTGRGAWESPSTGCC
ncbi:hypothetical protein [Halomonas cerina]|uniref:Uncharacterized protein n=1 Tax=Halomonas cerina TaxID=447424 RepID=A0A839VGI6_9GAMM|nr:hypothetical protein [Halomonas cerina]MBB3192439.1 hypothetical protein [Halomonas cerina]